MTENPESAADAEIPALPPAPDGVNVKGIETDIVAALKTCYDPEIPVDIYQLGLIYTVRVSPEGRADIEMTLTSPACPVAGTLPPEVENKVRGVEGVTEAHVELVWDPPWNPDMMSEAAKLQLGL